MSKGSEEGRKRRGTLMAFGGSRRSLTGLLFPSSKADK